MRHKNVIAVAMAFVLFLAGCGGQTGGADSQTSEKPVNTESHSTAPEAESAIEDESVPTASPKDETPVEPYKAPPFAEAVFHPDAATGEDGAFIDLSCVSEGYVAVSVESDVRLKFQVVKDDQKYNYDIASDGTPSVFPLQMGDGEYRFRVMENISGSNYAERYAASAQVTLKDEFQPYLRPSNYADYSTESACVKKAAELAATVPDAVSLIGKIYEFVCETVTYDFEKAANIQNGYMPVPDETMETGYGICFDYASLSAAMLRSQGIPTKIIFGYVSPDDVYHAWNMFYTEETGWVTVSFEVNSKNWNRLDLTFAANGSNDEFIGDGSNYADVYMY